MSELRELPPETPLILNGHPISSLRPIGVDVVVGFVAVVIGVVVAGVTAIMLLVVLLLLKWLYVAKNSFANFLNKLVE